MAYCCQCKKEIPYIEVLKTSFINKIRFFWKSPFKFITINWGFVPRSTLVTCPHCGTFNLSTLGNYYSRLFWGCIFAILVLLLANYFIPNRSKETFFLYVLLPAFFISPFLSYIWWKYFVKLENFGFDGSKKIPTEIKKNIPTKINNEEKIKCPACSVLMEKVATKSHYDIPIIIDQCSSCGGLWFDSLEFHQIKLGEAKNIENINKEKLREFSQLKKTNLICPKDDTILIQFKDFNFPREILTEKCSSCGGFWFNCGKFTQFQNTINKQKEISKSKTPENTELQNQVMKMLESSSSAGRNSTLRNVASFLSTPVGGINDSSSAQSQNANQVAKVAPGALELILNLLIK